MATAKTKPPRRAGRSRVHRTNTGPRPRTPHLPGLAPRVIREIETAAERYVEVPDRRMAATKSETEAQLTLLTVMRKHNLTTYRLGDAEDPLLVQVVDGKTKVSVRKVKGEESGLADHETEFDQD